jgi:hypothetical protein
MASPSRQVIDELPKDFIPPLENGDWLSRGEFERRFNAMPGLKRAELIEGVVHLPSPIAFNTTAVRT